MKTAKHTDIIVDEAVKELIKRERQDFRLCTACSGPALVPVFVKPPKDSDIKIPVGDYFLYISEVQASYVDRVSMDMLYDPQRLFSCPALNEFR